MFEGALNRGPQANARFGTGTFLSVAFHAGVLAGAILLSSGEREAPVPDRDLGPIVVAFPQRRPATQLARPAAVRPGAQPQRSRIVIPTRVRPLAPAPEVVPGPAPDVPVETSEPVIGAPIGPGTGTCEGDGCAEAVPCEGEGCGGEEQVLVLTPDMAPPVRIEGEAPQYTRAAIEARIEGMTIVKCVIPRSGIPERCRIVKPLPYLDQAVLGAISTWRYRPATLDGVPVAVDYVLRIRVQLPR